MAEPLSRKPDLLSPRKREILRSVIQYYVAEVRPVSSQVLAEGFQLSSATVRNELAALEELGYLRQLHTSGGRIPTDLAYRLFVEELIDRLTDTLAQQARVSQVYGEIGREAEALIEGTLDLLTAMTGQVAWVSLPTAEALDIRSLSFVEIDTHGLLIVLVTGSGTMQSRLMQTAVPVKDLNLGRLTELLNSYLRGRSIVNVDYGNLGRICRQSVDVPQGVVSMLEEFFSGLSLSTEKIVFGDALRLVLQPEFTSRDNLGGVLGALQDKETFVTLLRRQLSGARLQTIIGTENLNANLHDCSLVVSRYQLPGGADGTVGVLGPTRQHYERSLSWVKIVGEAVARALSEIATRHQDSEPPRPDRAES